MYTHTYTHTRVHSRIHTRTDIDHVLPSTIIILQEQKKKKIRCQHKD